MAADADKPIKRKPLKARPQPEADRAAVRKEISVRFAKSLDYLSK